MHDNYQRIKDGMDSIREPNGTSMATHWIWESRRLDGPGVQVGG